MNYLFLIKYLFNIDNYKKYRHHIKIEPENKEFYWLFKTLDTLINKYNKSITFEEFALWVQVNLGNNYEGLLKLINNQNISDYVIEDVLKELKEKDLAFKLAKLSLDVSEGKEPFDKIQQLINQFETHKNNLLDNIKFVSFDLETLYDEAIKSTGLRWRLESLNSSLGSLRKGDFGFIFARPETGKTTFLASECTNFAGQTGQPIAWFNNEEQGNKVALRCISSAIGITTKQIINNRIEVQKQYNEITNNNIVLYDNASLYKKEIESICKELQPSAIVIDQLDKIKGFDADRDDLKLGKIYNWARELAKEYAPVIGVSQADASGEGRKYLTMDNVAGAKTTKQAEADWILGIGKTHEPGFELIRYFNICKNKLIGDEDSDPKKRHGKFEVLIQPEIGRYRDI